MTRARYWGALAPGLLFAAPALAEEAARPTINGADTGFVIMCAMFVMLMTVPGLAMFYAGLSRAKNVLSVMTHVVATCAVVAVAWVIIGYSLAFDEAGGFQPVIGGLSKAFFANITQESVTGTVSEYAYAMFMLMFAGITPAIIVGAFAERIRFSAVLIFMALWLVLNFAPMAHMGWSANGWAFQMGAQDFAGGNVVHLNAGVAALVAALVIGPRMGYGSTMMAPHNLTLTTTGACLLWVGWLAFCGGCALVVNGFSSLVMLNTFLGGAGGALGWMAAERAHRGRASTLGAVSGLVAGLVGITPACGFVGPAGSLAVGFLSALPCVWAVESLKHRFGYDDSFDAFGVHGVGAIAGCLLTSVFALPVLGGLGFAEGRDLVSQLGVQALLLAFSAAYSAVSTWICLKIADALVGLRVSPEDEQMGLDLASHGERGYRLDDAQLGEAVTAAPGAAATVGVLKPAGAE
ncbi:ammonium transporter [Camelimonas abortus]|uniref:Ammonium transporter n=1 Tax=Camelimonas abortus TaxID=1017184 RepID=A0ABV7LG47_9HYPH